jgi:Protein of unknown function (DUF3048) N-terminal domain/Protein of unknown function (DUF3048) C-terminal domain
MIVCLSRQVLKITRAAALRHSEYVRAQPVVGLVVAVIVVGAGVTTMSSAEPSPTTGTHVSARGPLGAMMTKTPSPSPRRTTTPNDGAVSVVADLVEGSPASIGSREGTPYPNRDVVGRAPLTGLPTDPARLGHPAVTIKVSNEGGAHPQRGLRQADIVFVELITTATTRLAAVYHSAFPDEVGPVRSLRPTDAALIGPTRGILADTMAADWVVTYVHELADVDDLGTLTVGGSGAYRIDNRRRAPNHVFAKPTTLLTLSKRTAPPAPYFRYAPDVGHSSAATSGSPATRVDIAYGDPASAYWTYDDASGRWLRFEARGPHILQDGTQVAATNVLVLHAQRDTTMPNAGEHMTVLDFVDANGTLELLTGGRSVTGQWTKAGVNDPFVLTDAREGSLFLTPGNTWVECVSEATPVSVTPGS